MKDHRKRAPRAVHDILRTPGKPLDASSRAHFEARFSADLSRVRVHHDTRSAAAVDARAYTVGNHVVFGETPTHQVLGHELSHVVHQQNATAPSLQRLPNAGIEDPVHHGLIENFHGDFGDTLSDADIKYRTPPREDLSLLHVDAVPDLTASRIITTYVRPHVNDPQVASLSWNLTAPDGRILHSMSTDPSDSDARTRPFLMDASMFSGGDFQPGLYHLTCTGRDDNGWARVRATRDFRVLTSDLTTGTAVKGSHGELQFTRYLKSDAPQPGQQYDIETILEFKPHTALPCSEIGWLQTVQSITNEGAPNYKPHNIPMKERGTKLAWSIDRKSHGTTPYYGATVNPWGDTIMTPGYGHFGGTASPHAEAELRDGPDATVPQTRRFESCAVCLTLPDVGEVYGCATWGYTADPRGRVRLHPRSFSDVPTEEFREAHRMWNAWRATKPAGSQPEAAPALRTP